MLVGTGSEAPGLYAIVDDCLQAETDGVAVKVGGLDELKDWGAAVFFGHFSPPLEIVLELLGESDDARP